MTKKYKAIDVANYILWYVNEDDKHKNKVLVSALKLHKLVYYVAAKYAQSFNELLFEEKIEKWQYGPVTPSVYHAFKGRGYNHISKTASQFELADGEFKRKEFSPNIFDETDKKMIQGLTDMLVGKSARELVEATHKEDAWKNNEREILSGVRDLTYDLLELRAATIPQ